MLGRSLRMFLSLIDTLHHAAHAGVSHWHFGLVLLLVADNALSSEEHACNRSSIFKSHTSYLGGVYHTSCTQVTKLLGLCVVAIVTFAFAHLVHDNSTLDASVAANLTERFLYGTTNDVDTSSFIGIVTLHAFEALLGTNVSHTATGYDTFLNGCAGCTKCIIATVFLFFLLSFAGSTNLKHTYTA